MEPEVVYRAKQYAKKRNISLFRLIQDYLDQLSKDKLNPESNIAPEISALTGILKGKVPDDVELKNTTKNHYYPYCQQNSI